ncbi:uncharacterized protein G2W53_004067 [Senna tora]|uniref:Uncharacterized protein n=1 Tax=Senna tora TaxID=362788 RepID=A0A835CGZ2_9FABA|nr:uncharacterized protein G2W53_004067 [Senna tora]
MNKDLLSEVLQVPNHGLCPDLAGDIITETYSKGEYIKELMGKESSVCQSSMLIADTRILFTLLLDQVVMPRLNKANDSNNAELFIMWSQMVITRIAKFIKADLSQYEGEEASFQKAAKVTLPPLRLPKPQVEDVD